MWTSSEVRSCGYLVSPGDKNVKVRDDLLDIKVLHEVNDDGLERWEPVMKAGFPLVRGRGAGVRRARQASSGVRGGRLPTRHVPQRTGRTPGPGSHCAGPQTPGALHGRRLHCRTLRGGGGREQLQTVAIESEDPAAVIAAVREVGLAGWANTSFRKPSNG